MAEDEELWRKYRSGDRVAFDELVDKYLPLVKVTVGRMSLTVPSFVSRDELASAGAMGLLSALEKYDPTREAKFSTYAITRIRGAILDELRSHDLLGRVTRNRISAIQDAESELQNRGEELSSESVAEQAGLTLDEYFDAMLGSMASHQVSLSETVSDGQHALEELISARQSDSPGHRLEMEEVVALVQELLNEKEKLLVVLYYNEGLTLKEIGEIMEVSESRVCQMHTAMALRIRKRLEKSGIIF